MGWFHFCEMKITQLMYINVDEYWISNKCIGCGMETEAIIRYPHEVLYRCGNQIKFPDQQMIGGKR